MARLFAAENAVRFIKRAHRPFRYAYLKTLRLKDTPHSIAAGFAAGASVSMLPFPGLHFFLGFMLAFITRGGMLASAIGTAVGNPWTFPLIWIGTYKLGVAMMGLDAAARPDISAAMGEAAAAIKSLSFSGMFDSLSPILVPMLVGSVPVALLSWIGFYTLILWALRDHKSRRTRRAALRIRPPSAAE